MITRIHMQDQIHNRIDELMNEKKFYNWNELFQNITTLSLIIVFITFGLRLS
jgi:hypothetical protein